MTHATAPGLTATSPLRSSRVSLNHRQQNTLMLLKRGFNQIANIRIIWSDSKIIIRKLGVGITLIDVLSDKLKFLEIRL